MFIVKDVCVCVCMLCVCVYLSVCAYVSAYVCLSICLSLCLFACLCASMYVQHVYKQVIVDVGYIIYITWVSVMHACNVSCSGVFLTENFHEFHESIAIHEDFTLEIFTDRMYH